MVKNEVLLVFFTFLLGYTLEEVNSKILAKLRNLECFPNSDWINMTCSLKAVSWKQSLVNIEADLKKDVNSIMVHAQSFKRFNTYQPYPLRANFDFCALLRGNGNNNYFIPDTRAMINDYTNINHTCPYLKGEKIIAKDLDWHPAELTHIYLATGAGRFRSDINIYGNGGKTKLARIVGYADITDQ